MLQRTFHNCFPWGRAFNSWRTFSSFNGGWPKYANALASDLGTSLGRNPILGTVIKMWDTRLLSSCIWQPTFTQKKFCSFSQKPLPQYRSRSIRKWFKVHSFLCLHRVSPTLAIFWTCNLDGILCSHINEPRRTFNDSCLIETNKRKKHRRLDLKSSLVGLNPWYKKK
jgi:hypothetical protein